MNTLHRQMDWRTLTIEPHRQQRRHHNRNVNGPLLPMDPPMDREDKSAPWLIGLAAVVAIYFIGRHFV